MELKAQIVSSLEELQLELREIISYLERYKQNPYFKKFIRIMVKNIGICKDYEYTDLDELIKLLNSDWKSANCLHGGIPEFYIYFKEYEKRKTVNDEFSDLVKKVYRLLETITKKETEYEQEMKEKLMHKLCICNAMTPKCIIESAKQDNDMRKLIKERLNNGVFTKIPPEQVGKLYEQYGGYQHCAAFECKACGTKWLFVACDFPAPGAMIKF